MRLVRPPRVLLAALAALGILGASASPALAGAGRGRAARTAADRVATAAGDAAGTRARPATSTPLALTGGWLEEFIGAKVEYTSAKPATLTFAATAITLRISVPSNPGTSLLTFAMGGLSTYKSGTWYETTRDHAVTSASTGSCVGQFELQLPEAVTSAGRWPAGIELVLTCGTNFYVGELAQTLPPEVGQGYYLYGSGTTIDGLSPVDGFGNDNYLSFLGTYPSQLDTPIVAMAVTPTGGGYWLAAGDGGMFAFGDAQFYGSMGGKPLNKPIVGMAATTTGKGYWLVASDGGIFAFGTARFYGSMGGKPLNKPIVGMASAPGGAGYWLVASDGGIFSFGTAPFYGSTGSIHLNKPVVGMSVAPTGAGYWMVASDGGIFAFGTAPFWGSTGNIHLNEPIVGMVPTTNGQGYWFCATDGGVFAFGDAAFEGSLGSTFTPTNTWPIGGMAVT